MGREPAVGVVIPVRDGERWLGDAISSVLEQTGPQSDVVVVDDGSRDASAAIAAGFGPPVRVVGQPPGGIGAARNSGVEQVRGELLAFLDADDIWAPTKLERQVDLLETRPDLDIVFGQARQFTRVADGKPVPLGGERPCHMTQAMLVRRSAFERVGSFAVGLHVAAELDWLLRARELRLREATLAEQVVWRRVHAENNSRRHIAARGELARALKASLDRRRRVSSNHREEAQA